MATISLRNIRKRSGSVTVIDGLSLDIADQEFLVLLGPSCCGKTTTMRMLVRPASTFVAGFIGSPMNLLIVHSSGGAFQYPSGTVPDVGASHEEDVVPGQRPEHLRLVAPDQGHLTGTVFSSELFGDAALVVMKLGTEVATVKVGPGEECRMGDAIGVAIDPAELHVFDAATGQRLDRSLA